MASLHNGRRERFAQELTKGKSAAEAYVEAGYSGSSKSMQEAASRLSRNVKVQPRVAEIQQRGAERAEITLADVTEHLKRIAAAAEEEGGAPGLSVARAAWMDVAKLNGLVVDKSESVSVTHTITDKPMSDEEWAAEYGEGWDRAS
ncbi:terminase small subunit [Xanthobacter autotrophicus]|uniref:terminase small subunit n=1 Tax=Xanthobacter autotrophicus TaxID=280 RepID=UPI0024A77CD7|nr:terminase small subunit [Xanthobacter autotrophicus]MDI4655521.1 terminase small subunit [Xanthobacter autotrophicus]